MKEDEKMFGQETVRAAMKRVSRELLDGRSNEFVETYALFDRLREAVAPSDKNAASDPSRDVLLPCDVMTFGKALWCVFSGNRKWTSPEGRDVTEILGTWRYAGEVIAKWRGAGSYVDYYYCLAREPDCAATVNPLFDRIKTVLESWGFVEGDYYDGDV